ncbi:MAG: putative endonuclease [Candidatus Dependentiae bacterium]|nr:putative endonuclease [Candidatus Dependentiae bacterium]
MKTIPAVYIMASARDGAIHVGVTAHLIDRITAQQGNGYILVYVEFHRRVGDALAREKQLKGGSRDKKIALIERLNPAWNDLYDTMLFAFRFYGAEE